MKKVRIKADTALAIIQGILTDEDVNTVLADPSAPEEWRDRTIYDILNVEYFTFKHRPISTADIFAQKIAEYKEAGRLEAVDRSFCVLSLDRIERLYSQAVDMCAVSVTLEYFIQTEKIKLLEYLIDDADVETKGVRIPVTIGDQTREAIVIFERPVPNNVQTGTPFGEMINATVGVLITLYPPATKRSDYSVSVAFTDDSNHSITTELPFSSFTFVNAMTQDAVPYVSNTHKTGNINLSGAGVITLIFEGYDNPFIDYISDKSLYFGAENGAKTDNNQTFTLSITRKGKTYVHTTVIKDHQITVSDDTNNETHTVSFTTRGIR